MSTIPPITPYSESSGPFEKALVMQELLHINKKSIMSEIDYVKKIREGFSYKAVKEVCTELGLSQKDFSESIGIDVRTLARRKKENRLHVEESDRLYRLVRIYAYAVEVLEDKSKAILWLSTPKITLGGKIPLTFLDTEAGTIEIERLLGRIEYGVYT
jgi:putative toxin-antitoxin system antitoxin component (TIGR02293 family)